MDVAPFPLPGSETDRLRLLAGYQIADTPPEPEYDRFADLAAHLFNAPVAGLSIVGAEAVWLKARTGIDVSRLDRGSAFCTYAILADGIFEIPDTLADPRFCANPIVVEAPHVRFYAAAPLVARPGHAIGTVWVLDTVPRPPLTAHERRVLADLASMVMDRLENRRLEIAERDARERFLNIAATSSDAIVCADEGGKVIFWNRSAESIFRHSAAEMLGRHHEILLPEPDRGAFANWLRRNRRRLNAGGQILLTCRRADGSEFPAEVSYSAWVESGRIVTCGILRDVTARHEAEKKLRSLAETDSLTGLANRTAFLERLEAAIRPPRGRREAQGCALLLIDLDRFKEVNDTLGHGAGDRVLQRIAQRLEGFSSATVHPARLSGDEFTIIIEGNAASGHAVALAERVRQELSRPMRIHGQPIDVGASIGIATFPDHAATAGDLLANADLALYRAKADGGDRAVVYASSLRQAALSRRQVENELRHAQRDRQFVLYYQPQVSTIDGSILGAEALLRWRHPQQGLLAPASFLSVLETSSMANSVGNWVIETAVAQCAEWVMMTGRPFHVAVNLFASQFLDGALVNTVKAALARHHLAPDNLELEITENVAFRHDAGIAIPLRRLVEVGVGVAFDDFGTGYGSLSHLKRVPVTRLKIDRSFVSGIVSDQGDAAIVRAVIALGRSLGLAVIAEGVETEAQRLYLDTFGCIEAQGYFFGAPMPASAFGALLCAEEGRQVA
jgi:diguanylate cyclase (GGDEF)-like protein/PAS domain S-box-containing protein